ncbi:MAG: DDE-type integrase/transposase/recombinase [Desulforhopalus sp.]|nr:DDE-type integrase/transposase/recombinase [Desulforhopalus sp.]
MPEERLLELQQRLDLLPPRNPERMKMIQAFADLYAVSISTVYRCLREKRTPKSLRRSDAGVTRVLPSTEMELYCQIIAAMKLKTSNKKGHHLPTTEALRLLENFGIETTQGLKKPPEGILKKTTVNRYLKKWGYDFLSLKVEPVSVRFQAKHSNDCWQFDLSPSDLKQMPEWPAWVETRKGRPTLMLYSVVDDRSGVAYQEYHVVYGEDVEAALRFLYRAMTPKEIEGFPFQGIPSMIYTDNGPIAKSRVFQRVLEYLGIELRTHMPKGKDGRRTTARAKGKVERPFRTIKELHETLYHFHTPKNEEEANSWLLNYVLRYNEKDHRSEKHSRIEDWINNPPPAGLRKMCSWDRYATFAREPERRKVAGDATIKVSGVTYRVDSTLAGHDVIIWWGLFDSELFIEHGEKKSGPFYPDDGPIPLHKFRAVRKTKAEKRADSIEKLAEEIALPKNALTDDNRTAAALMRCLSEGTAVIEFKDPDPFQEFTYPGILEAKIAIANYLGIPLAKLPEEDRQKIDVILADTLLKKEIIDEVRCYFRQQRKGVKDVK